MWRAFWHVACYSTHNTHTSLTALFPGLPRWTGTRKVKPIWISLKQETVSSSGISWTIYKSAPRSRQITTSAPLVFYRPDAFPVAQPTASKHSRPTKKVNKQSVYYTAKVKKAVSEFWTLKKDKYEPQRLKFVLMIFATMQIVCMYIEQKIWSSNKSLL